MVGRCCAGLAPLVGAAATCGAAGVGPGATPGSGLI
jgi:hypothetical protein